MMMSFERITMAKPCPSCSGPVMCDDPAQVEDQHGYWWHVECLIRINADLERMRNEYVAPEPLINWAAALVWLVLLPLSSLGFLALLTWFGWLLFIA